MATREKPYLHIGFLLVSQKRKLLEEAMYRLDLMSHSSVIQCYHQFDQVFFFFKLQLYWHFQYESLFLLVK